MSERFEVERQSRSLTDMVKEGLDEENYVLEDLSPIMVYSIDGDTTYSGMIASDEETDYLNYDFSVGQEDLPVETVRAYLEEFYTDQDNVLIKGSRGVQGDDQMQVWADNEGIPQKFATSFNADSERQEEQNSGKLRIYLTLYDSWENPGETAMDSIQKVNSTLQNVDRPELSEARLIEYWSNQLNLERNDLENLRNLPQFEPNTSINNLDDLTAIEFKNKQDAKPETEELVNAYRHIRNEDWQPTVLNRKDFRATDHTLSAQGYSDREFENQLNWIEDRLNISKEDQKFAIEFTN